jgi:hypothetical protein
MGSLAAVASAARPVGIDPHLDRAVLAELVVARATIEDRLDGAPPKGETLTALRLRPDPGLAA